MPNTATEQIEIATAGKRSAERSVADLVVRDVIRGLYDGDFEPGQRLYESELTKSYGVSRGPVREALNKLAAIGIVDLTMQRGARVKILNIDEALDTLVVAQALVSLAAKLAAQNISVADSRSRMVGAAQNLASFDAASASADFAMARSRFYATIAAIANNAQLTILLPDVRIHLIRVQFRVFLQQIDARRHSDYRRISDAILAGRGAEAEQAVRMHFGRAIDALRKCKGI